MISLTILVSLLLSKAESTYLRWDDMEKYSLPKGTYTISIQDPQTGILWYYNGQTKFDQNPWSETPVYLLLEQSVDNQFNFIRRPLDGFYLTTSNKVDSLDYSYLPNDGHRVDFASFSGPSQPEAYMSIHNYKYRKNGHYQLLFKDSHMTRRMYDSHYHQNRMLQASRFTIKMGKIDISVKTGAVIDEFTNYGCEAVEFTFTSDIQKITTNSETEQETISDTVKFGFGEELPGWHFEASETYTNAKAWSKSLSTKIQHTVSYKMTIPGCSTGKLLGDTVNSTNPDIIESYTDMVTGYTYTAVSNCDSDCPGMENRKYYDEVLPIPPSNILDPPPTDSADGYCY